MDTADEYDPRYLAGIDQFNAGDYFDAHESWEAIWRDGPPGDRLFYQSLIQAAVAIYHADRGNSAGARRLSASGRAKAADFLPSYHGLDLTRFWRQTDEYVQSVLSPHESADRPIIRLTAGR